MQKFQGLQQELCLSDAWIVGKNLSKGADNGAPFVCLRYRQIRSDGSLDSGDQSYVARLVATMMESLAMLKIMQISLLLLF